HAGFQGVRGAMPMNIRGGHPGKGLTPQSRKDIERILEIWASCREKFGKMSGEGGPLLFGAFSVADAFYAPVVTRFQTYGVELPPVARAYSNAVLALPAVREWSEAGRRETEFVA